MQKTNIEWTDFTSNPVKGLCPVACPYCYARAIYRRFKWDETIRVDWAELHRLEYQPPPGAKVFVGSMIDLFHPAIQREWLEATMACVRDRPDVTYQFLTKCPQRLKEFSPFPSNAWVGVSATTQAMFDEAALRLWDIDAETRFISVEPMLEFIDPSPGFFPPDLVIIGAQTKPTKMPELEWVSNLESYLRIYKVPVFEKDSLAPLFPERELRREWPK